MSLPNATTTSSIDAKLAKLMQVGPAAWPTVLLFLVLCIAFAGTFYSAATGAMPATLAIAINSYVCFAFFTVEHEAAHRNISRRYPALNDTIGCIAAFIFAPPHTMDGFRTWNDDCSPSASEAFFG